MLQQVQTHRIRGEICDFVAAHNTGFILSSRMIFVFPLTRHLSHDLSQRYKEIPLEVAANSIVVCDSTIYLKTKSSICMLNNHEVAKVKPHDFIMPLLAPHLSTGRCTSLPNDLLNRPPVISSSYVLIFSEENLKVFNPKDMATHTVKFNQTNGIISDVKGLNGEFYMAFENGKICKASMGVVSEKPDSMDLRTVFNLKEPIISIAIKGAQLVIALYDKRIVLANITDTSNFIYTEVPSNLIKIGVVMDHIVALDDDSNLLVFDMHLKLQGIEMQVEDGESLEFYDNRVYLRSKYDRVTEYLLQT